MFSMYVHICDCDLVNSSMFSMYVCTYMQNCSVYKKLLFHLFVQPDCSFFDSSSTGLFHRKKSKIERDRDTKSPAKGGSPEPKVKVQGPGTCEEAQEQKVKVATAKIPTPELLRKKFKDGAATALGTKDKSKEVI